MNNRSNNATRILPIIVISQFLCTSLWFAGNAILKDLIRTLALEQSFVANLTSAVQLGFISGTLIFAILMIADRFSPVRVFFICSIIASFCNLGILLQDITTTALLGVRFFTGFFLAGIYPVGMKIAADHFDKGLGRSLGFLVGALVLGTASPHLLKSFSMNLPVDYVIISCSIFSFLGGVFMITLVPDGPFRKPGQKLNITGSISAFSNPGFRAPAFGYFGHMWELYTFWAFVPLIFNTFQIHHSKVNVPLFSFIVIASGGIACMISGILSKYLKPKLIASTALFLSGTCCLISPFYIVTPSINILTGFLIFWGLVIAADSPMFSTLVSNNAPAANRGTSLTILNCIGFAITVLSLQFINWVSSYIPFQYLFTLLAFGPILGLLALFQKRKNPGM